MNREIFLKTLEELLKKLPAEERENALIYYNDYFDDAGVENEARVIEELGSPEKVAKIIYSDYETLKGKPEGGEYTENGYMDSNIEDKPFEVARESDIKEQEDQKENEKKQRQDQYNNENRYNDRYEGRQDQRRPNPQNTGLWILIIVLSFPIWLPVIATVFGLSIGFLAAGIGITVGLVGGGIGCFAIGIYRLFVFPMEGILAMGVGLVLIGIGLLCGYIFIKGGFYGIRGITKGISNLIHGRRGRYYEKDK